MANLGCPQFLAGWSSFSRFLMIQKDLKSQPIQLPDGGMMDSAIPVSQSCPSHELFSQLQLIPSDIKWLNDLTHLTNLFRGGFVHFSTPTVGRSMLKISAILKGSFVWKLGFLKWGCPKTMGFNTVYVILDENRGIPILGTPPCKYIHISIISHHKPHGILAFLTSKSQKSSGRHLRLWSGHHSTLSSQSW